MAWGIPFGSMSFSMEALQFKDLEELKSFTDRAIGDGYYTLKELQDIFEKSKAFDPAGVERSCSFLLKKKGQIHGVRITYPPGKWSHGKGQGQSKSQSDGLTQGKWPFALKDTAYFQSLFLDETTQGQGLGAKLSQKSIEVLKILGARGVVCHSWKESPHNSSSRYLEKMGFVVLAEHPKYWKNVDYNCTRCGAPPCQCTALEMYLRLDGI